ncbi:MAG TPA: GGDEF domain-containing protein [Acidothermaceae bacterium]
MSEQTDRRNTPPAPGSALWWYLWAVIVLAIGILVVAVGGLHHDDISAIARRPAFWLVAAPMVVTTLRPIVPKNRAGDGTFALVVFLFALLLYVGLPAAAFLCSVTMLLRGAMYKQSLLRNVFNVAQHVVTLGTSWLVLRVFGIDPTPLHTWTFTESSIRVSELVAVGLAGIAYLVMNNGTVYIAVAISEGTSLVAIIREDVRHLAIVGVAMVSLSPLVLIVMVHMWPLVPLFYPALVSLYQNATLSVAREHDALHDSLTGLGNREMLHREASKVFDGSARQQAGIAVLVLDLDGFKGVNDQLGHAAGDRVLQVVAERLTAVVRPSDVVARLGGDEFVVIVQDVPSIALARTTAVRLLDRVNGPCQIDGNSFELRASLGVALAPDHGVGFDSLLRRADRAMYVAKASGCGVAVFDPAQDGGRGRMPMAHEATSADH